MMNLENVSQQKDENCDNQRDSVDERGAFKSLKMTLKKQIKMTEIANQLGQHSMDHPVKNTTS